jgi:hypothetical protein
MHSKNSSSKEYDEIYYWWNRFLHHYKDVNIEKPIRDLNKAFQDTYGLITITLNSEWEDKKDKIFNQTVLQIDCFKYFGKPFLIGWEAQKKDEQRKLWANTGRNSIDVLVHEIDLITTVSKNKKHILTFMQAEREKSKYILEKLIYGRI